MATLPPVPPPPPAVRPGYPTDWKAQRRYMRDQAKWQRQQLRMQERALRRRSLVGPILLIGVGVILLMAEFGHLGWLPLLQWFARWWPVLLIAAGAVRIAEWMLDQRAVQAAEASGQPLLRTRALGGGTIWLLVLIVIIGGLAQLTSRGLMHANEHGWYFSGDDFDHVLGDAHDSDDSLVHAIGTTGSITLDNARGDVTVSGTGDDGQVHISVHKQVYAMNDKEAETRAAQLQPAITGDLDHLAVRVPDVSGAHADIHVDLPRGVAVTVSSDRGEVNVNGVHAAVSVNGNHGSVSVNGVTGPVIAHLHSSDASFSAHSVTGPVTLDGRTGDLNLSDVHGDVQLNGDFFGTSHFERVNGAMHFKSSRTDLSLARLDGELELNTGAELRADQVLGPVVLQTRDRNITLERVQGSAQVTNRNGSVSVTQSLPLGGLEINNHHGSVDVGLPAAANFVLNAETRNGDLENDFGLQTGSGDRPSVQGTVGRGGALIRIITTDGDVTVRRSSVDPLPPVPPQPKVLEAPQAPAAPPAGSAAGKAPAAPAAPKAPRAPHGHAGKPSAPPAPPAGASVPL